MAVLVIAALGATGHHNGSLTGLAACTYGCHTIVGFL